MTALEGRITRLELMLNRLQMQLVSLSGQVARVQAAALNQGAVVQSPGTGGGGAGGAFVCTPTAAIAGGASGTANVFLVIGGTGTLFATGATIVNPYLSSTTAGRILTLGANPDGTFLIFGQSCT